MDNDIIIDGIYTTPEHDRHFKWLKSQENKYKRETPKLFNENIDKPILIIIDKILRKNYRTDYDLINDLFINSYRKDEWLNWEEGNKRNKIGEISLRYQIKEDKEVIEDNKINNSLKGFIKFYYDKLDLAEKFNKRQPLIYDKSLLWWFWDFKDNRYVLTDETDIMNMIDNSLATFSDTVRNKERNEIIEALKRVGRKNMPKQPSKDWIQFKNFVIDIKTGERFKPTSEYFFVNPIPHNIGESEDTPIIDKLLNDWVGEEKQILYEIIAYCIYTDYPIHRIFCFSGSGRNGKSTYLELIRRLIGKDNITGTELDLLIENRFESAKLFKKLICMMGETNYNNLKNTSILKRLTGQDLIGYEFKNKNPFDDYNYAKILIATNGIPISHDKSEGFYRRWIIVDFNNKFPEGKDILSMIPDIEYDNLCLKSVRLLKEILNNCRFTGEHSIEEKTKRYEEKSNPLIKFIQKYTFKDFDGFVYKYEFRDRFLFWAKENGYRKLSEEDVNGYMKEIGIEASKKSKGESRIWAWEGIDWLENKVSVQAVQDVQQLPLSPSYVYPECKPLDSLDTLDGINETWDNKVIIHRKCELCDELECNESKDGHYYCVKHFNKDKIEEEIIGGDENGYK